MIKCKYGQNFYMNLSYDGKGLNGVNISGGRYRFTLCNIYNNGLYRYGGVIDGEIECDVLATHIRIVGVDMI